MPNERRQIPIPSPSQDAEDTSPEALQGVVDDAVTRWNKTKDEATGMVDAERQDDAPA